MGNRSPHVIEEYSSKENTIVCICKWKGDADKEWLDHRIENRNNPVVGYVKPPKQRFNNPLRETPY